uniref:Galectin n=1 Tax=Heterorhabditis bacteriophora TaxID=37862 RepID=A0A1I7XBX2_HETBA
MELPNSFAIEVVLVGGQFNVAVPGEKINVNYNESNEDHPLFNQLHSLRIAREYLRMKTTQDKIREEAANRL